MTLDALAEMIPPIVLTALFLLITWRQQDKLERKIESLRADVFEVHELARTIHLQIKKKKFAVLSPPNDRTPPPVPLLIEKRENGKTAPDKATLDKILEDLQHAQ